MSEDNLPITTEEITEEITNEADVPTYTLPELLIRLNGDPVTSAADWQTGRRPELLHLFEEQVYGKTPPVKPPIHFEPLAETTRALNGLAQRKQIAIQVGEQPNPCTFHLLIYLPANHYISQRAKRNGPVPLFVGLNFNGNHTIHADPEILISEGILASGKETDSARGSKASSWVVEQIIERGYGVATIYCGDMADDNEETWRLRATAQLADIARPRQPSDAGAIGIWAWGLSRAMDYFETDPDIDSKRVAVMGHSRLGKTALWAGAQDQRFRMVISNNSGCGGAALSRRCFGETVHAINTRFPHWFSENFRQYNQNEAALPIDQHMLLALIAPRPLYVASAEDDSWADPRGEFLGIKHASPLYELFGQAGLPADEMPAVNQPAVGSIGYHIRTGGHAVTSYDWTQTMNYADRVL